MVLTDIHGEIIVKEAIDQTRFTFDYDSQEYAYTEVLRLLDLAITNLQRTDGAVDATYLGRTDHDLQRRSHEVAEARVRPARHQR